jgi:hypothetical protein
LKSCGRGFEPLPEIGICMENNNNGEIELSVSAVLPGMRPINVRAYIRTIRVLITIIVLLVEANCKSGEEKNFYNTTDDWDIAYVPIIPPFRAYSLHDSEWFIESKEPLCLGKSRGGSFRVYSFGVSKNYIYGKTENARWFLLNVVSPLYSEYSTEKELLETLGMYKLDRNPIESCDKYVQDLIANKRCYWYPIKGKEPPKYEGYRPGKVYTISVQGKEKVTDFKVKETIRRTTSKVYFFKIDYDNKNNDLLYVSFNCYPRLINDSEIYSAYAEDSNSLSISIYTPWPEAQSKGIEEKDRIVLTKKFELK